MNDLIRIFERFFTRATTGNAPDISLAADFEPGKTFRLYVGVGGVVKGIDETGNVINREFIVGYHPVTFKKILSTANGTTATNLAACY